MMRRVLPRLRRDRRGSVAVEYALVLPVFLAFCCGILEFSHYAYLRICVANAAQDAVRYLSVNSAACSGSDYATRELNGLGLTAATITVDCSDPVTVSIRYPYVPFVPGLGNVLPSLPTISASGSMLISN